MNLIVYVHMRACTIYIDVVPDNGTYLLNFVYVTSVS